MPPTLQALLDGSGLPAPPGAEQVVAEGVTYDSRTVSPGDVFVAISGFHVDGAEFATAAAERGAVAVVAERPVSGIPSNVAMITVANARIALAQLSAELAGHPSRKLQVVGITGTDGKTTTTTMLWSAWQASGINAAASSTVEYRRGGEILANQARDHAPPTTGEAPEVQARLTDCLLHGCTHMALETSSHALELHRVDEVDYCGAVFTRITSEHLEVHGSVEGYVRAKSRLLELLDKTRDPFAVFDLDDPHTQSTLLALAPARRLTYSAQGLPQADVRAAEIHASSDQTHVVAQTPWGETRLSLHIPGSFNVANALAALTAALSSGATLDAATNGISGLTAVNGRMERIDIGQPFNVVVDYAHTADSLEKVLRELRPITKGKLWVVFGSAGERDIDKRPRMGKVAAQFADMIVITDEDPRGEDRMQVLQQIADGAIQGGARQGDNLKLIPDRPEAVAYAINHAEPGDTVLLAGKGHETSILTSTGSVPYNERQVAIAALQEQMGSHQTRSANR